MVESAGMEFSTRIAGAERSRTLGEMTGPVASVFSGDVQTTQSNVRGLIPSWKAFLTAAGLMSESSPQEENALEQAVPKEALPADPGEPDSRGRMSAVLLPMPAKAVAQNENVNVPPTQLPVP